MVGPPPSVCWMAVFILPSRYGGITMHDPANWVVLILVGGVLYFFAYVIIKSRQEEKKDTKDHHDR